MTRTGEQYAKLWETSGILEYRILTMRLVRFVAVMYLPGAAPSRWEPQVKLLILAIVFLVGSGQGKQQEVRRDDNIQFQILPDKLAYASGASGEIRYLVTNVGTQSIYIGRSLGGCSAPSGFTSLQILDKNGEEVPASGCAVDGLRVSDDELVRWITDAKFWILVEPGEIYGGVGRFELPTKAGKYRLVAELYRQIPLVMRKRKCCPSAA